MERFQNFSLSEDKDKENKIEKLFEEIEKDFEFVGCSAIEDKLQIVLYYVNQGVSETIESIMNANIRIWVLTGDKKVFLNFYERKQHWKLVNHVN